MKYLFPPVFALVLALFFACAQNGIEKKIATLEQAFAAAPTPGKADSLVALYREAVKQRPDDHAHNFRYLSEAAKIQYLRRDNAVDAVALADEALAKHGQGQNLTEPIGLLARIWNAREYRKPPATRFKPDELDKIQAYLQKNQAWLDSSLTRIDKAMTAANGTVVDTNQAEAFIETAEGYASIVQASNPDKYVDLILKAAGVAKSMGNANQSIRLYYRVAEKMPQHPKAPTALFMMGFVYENDLNDLAKAKTTYEDFLKRYPNDPDYADDAKTSLQLLGKTPEQIVREFQEKNPANRPQ